jgi:hypothetical protein
MAPPPQQQSSGWGLSDPFNFNVPGQPQEAPGLFGVTPSAWQHLAMFGGNMLAAANARTPSGHLAYGTGFAGPFGAATVNTMEGAQQQALGRMQMQRGYLQNALTSAQLPVELQRAKIQNQYMQQMLNGGGGQIGGSGPLPTAAGYGGQPNLTGAMHNLESGGQTNTPNIYGDGGAAAGPAQVHPAALADVNAHWGTNYTLPQLAANPKLGTQVGDMYLRMQQDRFPGRPDLALAAYNAGPGRVAASQLPGGPPLPTSTQSYVARGMAMAGAGDAYMHQGDQLIQQSIALANAQRQAQFLGLPGPVGDPAAMNEYAKQLHQVGLQLNTAPQIAGATKGAELGQQLQYAGPLAAAESTAKVPATLAEKGFALGPNGTQVAVPGGPADPRYAAAVEQAKTTANRQPITDRFGNLYQLDQNGNPIFKGRGSEVKEVWNPQTQQFEYGEVGGIGAGAIKNLQQGGAGAVPGEPTQPAKPGPLQQEFMHERGETIGQQFHGVDEAAAAAKDSNYLFDNMRQDAKTWDMGKFANIEGEGRAWLSAVAQSFGLHPTDLNEKLADFQAFNKSSGQLLRSAVHDTSSRAAVQEYRLIGDSLPQPTTSAQAFGQIADQWQGMNDFRLAKQQFMQSYKGKPEQFEVDFNSRVSPTAFMLNRMSQSPEGQQTMRGMVSRMQSTPEGKLALGRMLQGYTYAQQNGLFNDLPPIGGGGVPPPPGQ